MSTPYATFCPFVLSFVFLDHVLAQEQARSSWPCCGASSLKRTSVKVNFVYFPPAIEYINLPCLSLEVPVSCSHVSSLNHRALAFSSDLVRPSLFPCKTWAVFSSGERPFLPLLSSSPGCLLSLHCWQTHTIIISKASAFYLRVPFKLIHPLRFSYSSCEVRTINNSFKLNTELHCYGAKVNLHPKVSDWASWLHWWEQSQEDCNQNAATFLEANVFCSAPTNWISNPSKHCKAVCPLVQAEGEWEDHRKSCTHHSCGREKLILEHVFMLFIRISSHVKFTLENKLCQNLVSLITVSWSKVLLIQKLEREPSEDFTRAHQLESWCLLRYHGHMIVINIYGPQTLS